jgi:hypothetical protein
MSCEIIIHNSLLLIGETEENEEEIKKLEEFLEKYHSIKDKDIKLIYYSLELSAELLLAKLMCLYIYEEFGRTISYTDLMSWQEILSDEDYECVKASKA